MRLPGRPRPAARGSSRGRGSRGRGTPGSRRSPRRLRWRRRSSARRWRPTLRATPHSGRLRAESSSSGRYANFGIFESGTSFFGSLKCAMSHALSRLPRRCWSAGPRRPPSPSIWWHWRQSSRSIAAPPVRIGSGRAANASPSLSAERYARSDGTSLSGSSPPVSACDRAASGTAVAPPGAAAAAGAGARRPSTPWQEAQPRRSYDARPPRRRGSGGSDESPRPEGGFTFGASSAPKARRPRIPAKTRPPQRRTGRRSRVRREVPRSSHGTSARRRIEIPGRIAVPTGSSGPLKNFRSWKSGRKYHSGRGT